MNIKYLVLLVCYFSLSEEAVVDPRETKNTCVAITVPAEELNPFREISGHLHKFLGRNLDQGVKSLKKVFSTSGYDESVKIDTNIDEEAPLESYLLQHQIIMLKEIKELLADLKQTCCVQKSRPIDCSEILAEGYKKSGVYQIYPLSRSNSVDVYCDMETDGGGWTVFLARMKASKQVNFSRNWEDYKTGFGSANEEYWLGNDILHHLTKNKNYVVRFDANDGEDKSTWGEWKTFKVDSENAKYKLTVEDYNTDSSAKDTSFTYHNGQKFSTLDNDNDSDSGNCATTWDSGWWYNNCFKIHPTGRHDVHNATGIKFQSWNKSSSSPFYPVWLQLKIRPRFSVPAY